MAECSQTALQRSRLEWQLGRVIGRGSFSTVYQAMHRLEAQEYAIKMSNPYLKGICAVQWVREVQAWARACRSTPHPHLVQYHGAWVEPHPGSGGFVGLIQMELCGSSLGSMLQHGHTFSEAHLIAVLKQVSSALSHLHSLGIAHLDVKPDNIYQARGQEGRFKLGDLGKALPKDGSGGSEEGDNRYLPAELLSGPTDRLDRCDMFSLGASLYELARGHQAGGAASHMDNIRKGNLMLFPHLSAHLQKVIKSLVHKDPAKRPSASDMAVAHFTSQHSQQHATTALHPTPQRSPMGPLPLTLSRKPGGKENLGP